MRGGLYPVLFEKQVSSAPAVDPAATAWKAAVVSAGGTVSNTRLAAVSTYIAALKSASIWTVLDRLFILGPENATITQQATIDIVGLQSGTLANNPTVTTAGVTGNAVNSYFDTGFPPSSGVNFTLAAASLFHYVQTLGTSLGVSGAYNGVSAETTLFAPFSDSNFYPRINDEGGSAGGPFTTGFFVGDRSAGVVTGAHNGVDLSPNSVAAIALPAVSIFVGCINNNSVGITQQNASTFGIWGCGGALGATKRAALYTATNAYLTTVGAL